MAKRRIFTILFIPAFIFIACNNGTNLEINNIPSDGIIRGTLSACDNSEETIEYDGIAITLTGPSGSQTTYAQGGRYELKELVHGNYTVKVAGEIVSGGQSENHSFWPKEDRVLIDEKTDVQTVNFYMLDDRRCWKKEISDSDGRTISYIRLEGSPEEMGCQQGALLRNEIRDFRAEALQFVADTIKNNHLQIDVPVEVAIGIFIPKWTRYIKDHFFRFYSEMEGISESTGIDINEIVLPNVIWELRSLTSGNLHCSEFAALGKEGKLYHGFNSDSNFVEIQKLANKYRTIFFMHPNENHHSFMMVGTAGFVGAYTGINSEKISIAWENAPWMDQAYAGNLNAEPFAPYVLLLRDALENTNDIDSAANLISGQFRPSSDISLIADGKINNAKVMESYPPENTMLLRDMTDGVIWSANNFQDPAWLGILDLSELPMGDRSIRFKELLTADNPISVDRITGITEILHDDSGVYPICNIHNEFSILYIPEEMMAWISTATSVDIPCLHGTYIGFNIQAEKALGSNEWVWLAP